MDTLITSIPEKLPADIRDLREPDRPLPAGAQFFEEKFNAADLTKSLLLGLALIAAGIALVAIYLWLTYGTWLASITAGSLGYDLTAILIACVLVFGGYLLLRSIRPKRQLMQRQAAGVATRYGIFLFGQLLISNNWFDTTVIPRDAFRGVRGGAIHYLLRGEPKSFSLPAAFVGTRRQAVEEAIAAWAE